MTDQPITQSDLNKLEKYLDALWGKLGLDVGFSRHFLDRVNDVRNGRQITLSEIAKLFTETYKKYGPTFSKMGKTDEDIEGVISSLSSFVNMVFALKWRRDRKEFELLGQTVMRKKNFVPNNPREKKYTVEGTMFGNVSQDLIESVGKVKARNEAERFIKERLLEEYDIVSEDQLDWQTRKEFDALFEEIKSELDEDSINELSKAKLKTYLKKNEKQKEPANKVFNRAKGHALATKKLKEASNEDPEVSESKKKVDEVSQNTLASYIHKSREDEKDQYKKGNTDKAEHRQSGRELAKIKFSRKLNKVQGRIVPNGAVRRILTGKKARLVYDESAVDEQDSPEVNNVPGAETTMNSVHRWNSRALEPQVNHPTLGQKVATNLQHQQNESILNEEDKKQDNKNSNFARRMKEVDDALAKRKSTKDKIKNMRKNIKESGVFSTADTPYDDDGTAPIEEKKKTKKVNELSSNTLLKYFAKSHSDPKRVKGMTTAAKILKKRRYDESDETPVDEGSHANAVVHHVHFALSPYHKQNVKKFDDGEAAEKFKKTVERQGFKAHIVKKGINESTLEEGSEYYGVDPVYMNQADMYAKTNSFSPHAIRNDGNPAFMPGDGVEFDDNVVSMLNWQNMPLSSQIAARLEASKQFVNRESVNEISTKLGKAYLAKAEKDSARAIGVYHKTDSVNAARRVNKRAAGMGRAFDKVYGKAKVQTTNEDDEVNELSKKTLSNYVAKARYDAARPGRSASINDYAKEARNVVKRNTGLGRAYKRLTKENSDEVNELSKDTLTSYGKKSRANMYDQYWQKKNDKTPQEKADRDRTIRNRHHGLTSAGYRLGKNLHETEVLTKEDRVQEAKKLLNDKMTKLKGGDTVDVDPNEKIHGLQQLTRK